MFRLRCAVVALALADAAFDKDEAVRERIARSLNELGCRHPEPVLECCHSYLTKHSKLPQGHRVVILLSMELIIKDTLHQLSEPLARSIVALTSEEMTRSKEVLPEWQQAASNVLVAIGSGFVRVVMEELLQKFQPGTIPHFFTMKTLANLATANVYGMVPFLTATMGIMLPMLGVTKQDNMRWVFTYALSHFSESILEYVANLDKAPDPTVRKEAFQNEIYSAYDVLFNVWLQSKEAKLRLMIVEALGHMAHLLTWEKLDEQLPRLLTGFMMLYKKHSEPFYITQGLCQVLDASANVGSRVPEPQVDVLLNTLHHQVCIPVDFSNNLAMKNHNEILRCFTVISRVIPDRLLAYLLQKLEQNNERNRIGTLIILKHLINSAAPQIEDKKPVILSGLKLLLLEQSNKVKRALAQVVITMAHRGYLELEGGDQMVEFIIKQCANTGETAPGKPRPPDPEEVTDEALRGMSENILHLVTTTIDNIHGVLWPYLLGFVCPLQYSGALATVCRNAAFLAFKKRDAQAPDYLLNYETQVNLPKPPALLTRLLVVSSMPWEGPDRGVSALRLLQVMADNVHPSARAPWDLHVPKLVQHLEESEEQWSQKKWEDLLLKFLSSTLEAIADDGWTCHLGEEMSKQLPNYSSVPREKGFLYKCIGVVLRQSTNKTFVKTQLHTMLSDVKHTDTIEREGLAVGIGFSASAHLDDTISKLEEVAKNEVLKKTINIFNLLKDKSEVDGEKVRSTIILCYGYVSMYAPASLLPSRLEATIIKNVTVLYTSKILGIGVAVKDLTVKLSLIKTVSLIAQAVHPSNLHSAFQFAKKLELLHLMQEMIKAEPSSSLSTLVRQTALTACSHLVKLDPPLAEVDSVELMKTCLYSVYILPPLPSDRSRDDAVPDGEKKEALMKDTVSALHELLVEILRRDLTPGGLQTVFKQVDGWIESVRDHERERALFTVHALLRCYYSGVRVTSMVSLSNLGTVMGRLVPRCTDPVLSVRRCAIQALYAILRIHLKYEGFSPDYKDDMVEGILTLNQRLEQLNQQALQQAGSDIAKVLGKRVPQDQLVPLLTALLSSLGDHQVSSATGASVVLNGLIRTRGAVLVDQVGSMLAMLHLHLQQVSAEPVRHGALQAAQLLAQHHLQAAIAVLLTYPLPYDEHVQELWRCLGSDPVTIAKIFSNFIEALSRQLPYQEKPDPRNKKLSLRFATLPSLAITCAIKGVLAIPECAAVMGGVYPQLFATLLVRLGSSVGLQLPKELTANQKSNGLPRVAKPMDACQCSIEALELMLSRAGNADVVQAMESEQEWELIIDEERHHQGVASLARAMAMYAGPRLTLITESLAPVLSSVYDRQRITVVAFFAELLNHQAVSDLLLVDVLMNNLLGRLVDNSHVVRMLCIRGLGNIATGAAHKVHRYSTTVLSALIAGMDDKDDPDDLITLEAMSGLSKVLARVDESNVRGILINIALRIRPFFEKEKETVRAAAFVLFGNLSKFGDGESRGQFLEQVHTNLVSILLHLNDEHPDVRKACKFALRTIGSLLGSEAIGTMFQKHLLEDANLHYGEFMNDLAKYIIKDFPDKVNFYLMSCVSFFKSTWAEIRGNAVMLVGFFLGNVANETLQSISLEHVCGAVIILLKDPSAAVRTKAAEALSLFHTM
ncbi:unnamed protein product [Lampetra fluviatilis]